MKHSKIAFVKPLLIVMAFLISLTLVAAIEQPAPVNFGKYPYFKDLTLPSSSKIINRPGIVEFDAQVLNSMKSDGSDIRITENDLIVPIKIQMVQADDVGHRGRAVSSSSIRPDYKGISFGPGNALDGDYSAADNAYWQIDGVADPQMASIEIDLISAKLTDRVKVWSLNNDYTWNYIQIEGSNDGKSWDMIKSKTFVPVSGIRTVIYAPVQYRYLRFSFWHTQSLVINEMEIYGAASGNALFMAHSGRSYKLYYGDVSAVLPSYDTSGLFTDIDTPIATLGPQMSNPTYNVDTDADGIMSDNCPTISNPDQLNQDGDGIGDACDNCMRKGNADQRDADNDALGDACDNCPSIFNPDQYDDDADNVGYVCDDNDNDGVVNMHDNCPTVSNSGQGDKDNNGVGDACEDVDKDGISFAKDNCINVYNQDQRDTDNDRIGDACDNCLLGPNPSQYDVDSDGIGDTCEDDDSDSIVNHADNCLSIQNSNQLDTDKDSLGDACDNCPSTKNADQSDQDKNGIGDICDDADADGLINPQDNCPKFKNEDQKDQNNNGIGDVCEDYDSDGVANAEDNCLYERNPRQYFGNELMQPDKDRDGMGDACDASDDRATENKGLVWAVIIVVILVVGYLAYTLTKKSLPAEKK